MTFREKKGAGSYLAGMWKTDLLRSPLWSRTKSSSSASSSKAWDNLSPAPPYNSSYRALFLVLGISEEPVRQLPRDQPPTAKISNGSGPQSQTRNVTSRIPKEGTTWEPWWRATSRFAGRFLRCSSTGTAAAGILGENQLQYCAYHFEEPSDLAFEFSLRIEQYQEEEIPEVLWLGI